MTPSDRIALRIGAASIGVGALVLLLKAGAWWITGSAGLLSDALETVMNVASAGMAFAAFRYALRPADASHPYGHGKAEFFAAVLEGVLVILAAIAIFWEAAREWRDPHHIALAWPGLALNGVATAINAAWAWMLARTGRAARSAALVADGRHLMTDVVTSIGVACGVAVVAWTGIWALDPLIAAAVGVYVLVSGIAMISTSINELMDGAPEAAVVERIRSLVGEHAEGALEAHDLRTRRAGRAAYLEFHLVVPGEMRVAEAHVICDRIEAALREAFGDLIVTIHVEPEVKAKHQGIPVL